MWFVFKSGTQWQDTLVPIKSFLIAVFAKQLAFLKLELQWIDYLPLIKQTSIQVILCLDAAPNLQNLFVSHNNCFLALSRKGSVLLGRLCSIFTFSKIQLSLHTTTGSWLDLESRKYDPLDFE